MPTNRRGSRTSAQRNTTKNTTAFTSGRGSNYRGGYQAATDVQTGYGRDSAGRYNSNARTGQRAGRDGQIISRRQRYYDLRVAMGLSGG